MAEGAVDQDKGLDAVLVVECVFKGDLDAERPTTEDKLGQSLGSYDSFEICDVKRDIEVAFGGRGGIKGAAQVPCDATESRGKVLYEKVVSFGRSAETGNQKHCVRPVAVGPISDLASVAAVGKVAFHLDEGHGGIPCGLGEAR